MTLRLTLLGRSTVLLVAELLANGICWAVAAILFVPKQETRSLMSLALLAWTLGLRHALDADHISAIDNATRGLINLGQLPVTCGLFFSLGHSTIVLVVTVAIAISSDVVGDVGGIVGAAVSGSFLFIVGLANTIILWRILRRRREEKRRSQGAANSLETRDAELSAETKGDHHNTLTMKVIGPIMTFVNRPWKMYPVGILFGFGFDTASSIALLAVSAIANRGSNGSSLPSSHVVIFPLLFTAGMSLLDSADSVIMLFSYTGFPQHSWNIVEKIPSQAATIAPQVTDEANPSIVKVVKTNEGAVDLDDKVEQAEGLESKEHSQASNRAKMNVMSTLSIVLTVLSILLAFTISLITIMDLIGENCRKCVEAAEAADGGGLAGRWWRGWAAAGEQSGWIGIGIVGGFIVIVGGWYGGRWVYRRHNPTAANSGVAYIVRKIEP
ncbi:NicO-domain-containing protein [Ephemerocybe angulata]|uniref:Nickel/cobalt efflux system n=1 Tax=Ephemerocybe angulata TaxID=980116 RepID=A0A8H6I3U7_9AGAR|nr:NicO-domain-containing protein [Tulosesus angulatus]